MPFSSRVVSLLTAFAVSLPLAPAAGAYSQLCVFQKGIFAADVHVEFKRRSSGPNYADPNAAAEFDIVTRSHHVANDLNNSSWTGRGKGQRRYGTGPSYSRHVRDCWSREQLGNPQPGDVFSVRVGVVLGKTTYCQAGPERSRKDGGGLWHRVFTWSDSRSPVVFDIVGQSQDPLCMLHSFAQPENNARIVMTGTAQRQRHIWSGCVEGSEGFRRAACYAWRPRFKGAGGGHRAVFSTNVEVGYYFDNTADSVWGGNYIEYDGEHPAHFFVDLGKAAHLASVARRGADLNKHPHTGKTPLQLAVEKDRVDLGRILLGLDPHAPPDGNPLFRKASVNRKRHGTAALHEAVKLLRVEFVNMLVHEGRADVNLPADPSANLPLILSEAGVPEAAQLGAESGRALLPLQMLARHNDPADKAAQDAIFRTLTHAGAHTFRGDLTALRLADAADMNPDLMMFLFRDNLRWAIADKNLDRLRMLTAIVNHSVARSGRRFPNWADVNQKLGGFAVVNTSGATPKTERTFDGVPAIVRVFELDFPQGAIPLAAMKGVDLDAANEEGLRPLHLAALGEHLEVMRALLENGADKEAKAENGETPLGMAARMNLRAAVAALTEAGSDLAATDNEGRTPLDAATLGGHHEIEAALTALNAPRAVTDVGDRAVTRRVERADGGTVLHELASAGNARRLRTALEQQGEVNGRDEQGRTALMAAITANPENLAAVAELLLRAGADPHAGDEVHSPASLATRRNRGRTLRLLLDYGVEPNSTSPHRNLPLVAEAVFADAPDSLRALAAHGAEMNIRADGRIAGGDIYAGELDMLHHAAHAGYALVIRELLRGGATIGRPEADGLWPAGRAAKRKNDAALFEFMSTRRAYDTNLIARIMRAEPHLFPLSRLDGNSWGFAGLAPGETPSVDYIIKFIRENPDAELKFPRLLRRNDGASPDPNRQNANGETTLHHAVFHSLAATRELFIRDPFNHWRANPNIQDANGHPPIYWALGAAKPKHGTRMEIVETLLENNADPNLVNNNGQAALHQAARWGRAEFFPLLLRYGADSDLRDNEGRTALEVSKNEETRRELALATVDRADGSGQTELIRAAAAGDGAEVERLIGLGADVNIRDDGDNTALLAGILSGRYSPEWARALVDAGAEFHRVNGAGDTPLTAAAARGMAAIAGILTDAGARGDYARRDGWTPILLAATRGAPDGVADEGEADYAGVLRVLLATPGMDWDAPGPDGMSPLHIAALADDAEAVEIAAAAGADLELPNADGKTALELARAEGNDAALAALLRRGAKSENESESENESQNESESESQN